MEDSYVALIIVVVLSQLFVFSVIALLVWDRFHSREHIARLQAQLFSRDAYSTEH